VTRRVVIALLTPLAWAPPGTSAERWRRALAEDMVDLVASLAAADAAIAVGPPGVDLAAADLAAAVAWPSMPVYTTDRPTARAALERAAADGYDQAAVLAADAPDLPGLLVGKLLQPLGTRQAAVSPAMNGGLIGIAARLPVPAWFPDLDLDEAAAADVRAAAPRRALVAETPGWHRLRGPADLARLDPGLDGWDTTRALLSRG
jgi:glycosyltransferase A (GT-A) superfamily protein (DUF2064 family)